MRSRLLIAAVFALGCKSESSGAAPSDATFAPPADRFVAAGDGAIGVGAGGMAGGGLGGLFGGGGSGGMGGMAGARADAAVPDGGADMAPRADSAAPTEAGRPEVMPVEGGRPDIGAGDPCDLVRQDCPRPNGCYPSGGIARCQLTDGAGLPAGAQCVENTQCQPGTVCANGLCSRTCNPAMGCGLAAERCIPINGTNAGYCAP